MRQQTTAATSSRQDPGIQPTHPGLRSARDVPRSARRLLPVWFLAGGLLVGALWGGLARLWMRLIATEHPEFSWDGTIFIVAVFALAGMSTGPVIGARRRAWQGSPMAALRVLGCLATVLLSLGQGALLAPTLLFGGLAVARRSWPSWVRAGLGLLALGPLVLVHVAVAADWPHGHVRLLGAAVLAVVIYGGAVLALAQSYAPVPGARLPRSMRWCVLALPVGVVATIGLPNAVEAATARPFLGVAAVMGTAVLVARRRRQAGAPPAVLLDR